MVGKTSSFGCMCQCMGSHHADPHLVHSDSAMEKLRGGHITRRALTALALLASAQLELPRAAGSVPSSPALVEFSARPDSSVAVERSTRENAPDRIPLSAWPAAPA